MMIYNCFFYDNYEQLQQGRSSTYLMCGWELHPAEKILKIQNLGWEFFEVGKVGMKQIFKQRVSF